MKILKHLLAGVLTIALFTTYSPAKAGGHGDGSLYGGARNKWHDRNKDDGKQSNGKSSGNSGSGSTNHPVNDYAWALAIFSTAIGVKFITDKTNFAKN